jgi:PPOX class probable F420-dependent enzyme
VKWRGRKEMRVLDTSTEFGRRAERRLREERIIWLVTVRRNGMPQPLPVWFLWEGDTVLIFTRPGTQKLANLEHNPKAALHLDGDGRGGDIIVLEGEAQISIWR